MLIKGNLTKRTIGQRNDNRFPTKPYVKSFGWTERYRKWQTRTVLRWQNLKGNHNRSKEVVAMVDQVLSHRPGSQAAVVNRLILSFFGSSQKRRMPFVKNDLIRVCVCQSVPRVGMLGRYFNSFASAITFSCSTRGSSYLNVVSSTLYEYFLQDQLPFTSRTELN